MVTVTERSQARLLPGQETTAAARSVLLDVRDLRVHYPTPQGLVRAVDGVSFTVEQGETLGLVGESGCGKTALSRAIMGLTPRGAERTGQVIFDGRDLVALSDRELRSVLGPELSMIFQDPMTSLNPVMRIGAQVTEGLRLHRRLKKSDARARALELLRSVHIPGAESVVRRYPHQLSGGMRQRVMIAIALACGPKLLMADEPTTALDATVQAQILDLLEEAQRARGMSIVLVSHDLGVVASRTDHVAVMYAGKIVEHGPTATLFRETRMPYTEALLNAMPRLDSDESVRLQAIPGRPPSLLEPPSGCRFAARCRYAQDRCFVEEPALRDAPTPGHQYACFYPVGTPEGNEALLRNNALKRTSLVTGGE